MTSVQVPRELSESQASHCPPQDRLQHTPSVQNVLAQSVPFAQLAPSESFVETSAGGAGASMTGWPPSAATKTSGPLASVGGDVTGPSSAPDPKSFCPAELPASVPPVPPAPPAPPWAGIAPPEPLTSPAPSARAAVRPASGGDGSRKTPQAEPTARTRARPQSLEMALRISDLSATAV